MKIYCDFHTISGKDLLVRLFNTDLSPGEYLESLRVDRDSTLICEKDLFVKLLNAKCSPEKYWRGLGFCEIL